MDARNQRGEREQADGSGDRADAIGTHRREDERVDALAVLVLLAPGRFLAQRSGRDFEGAQGGSGDRARLSGAGSPGQQARRGRHQGEQCGDFGQGQGGPPRDKATEGAGRGPREQPQCQERKNEGGHSLAPVVHLGVAAPTEGLRLRGDQASHGLGVLVIL